MCPVLMSLGYFQWSPIVSWENHYRVLQCPHSAGGAVSWEEQAVEGGLHGQRKLRAQDPAKAKASGKLSSTQQITGASPNSTQQVAMSMTKQARVSQI